MTQIAHGDPVSAPPVAMERVVVHKRLSTMQGQPVDPAGITQGERMIIDIIVAPSETRTIPAIVVDLLPAGFEIEAVVNPSDAGRNGPYSWLGQLNAPRIAEARDDRFVAAIDALGNHGLVCVPSEANFVLVRFTGDVTAEAGLSAVAQAGYAVRHLPGQGLPDALRITIGKSEDMDRVIQALRTVCGEAS